ncbi:hypothetical protein D3C77_369460 [compost metagenome]
MAGGKEFLFLELDALPRRIAQYHIETALLALEYLRKSQAPVKEALTLSNCLYQLGHLRGELALMSSYKLLIGGYQRLMLGIFE